MANSDKQIYNFQNSSFNPCPGRLPDDNDENELKIMGVAVGVIAGLMIMAACIWRAYTYFRESFHLSSFGTMIYNVLRFIFKLIPVLLPVVDVVTDIVLVIHLYEMEMKQSFTVVLVFILLPMILMQIYGQYCFYSPMTCITRILLLIATPLTPLLPSILYIKCLAMANNSQKKDHYKHQSFAMLETIFESLPQLVIQTCLFQFENHCLTNDGRIFRIISISFSLLGGLYPLCVTEVTDRSRNDQQQQQRNCKDYVQLGICLMLCVIEICCRVWVFTFFTILYREIAIAIFVPHILLVFIILIFHDRSLGETRESLCSIFGISDMFVRAATTVFSLTSVRKLIHTKTRDTFIIVIIAIFYVENLGIALVTYFMKENDEIKELLSKELSSSLSFFLIIASVIITLFYFISGAYNVYVNNKTNNDVRYVLYKDEGG